MIGVKQGVVSWNWARAVTILAVSVPLLAHHSVFESFDIHKPVSVTGTLTKVDWTNPHIIFVVKGKAGNEPREQWTFESNPPSWYASKSLARTEFERAIGKTVTLDGVRAKNNSPSGHLQKMKMPDGTTLNLFTAPGRGKK